MACSQSKQPGAPVDAGAAASGGASYLFAGEHVARAVHWTRDGDVVAASAGALWRLPGGVLGSGATLVDTRLADAHGVGHKRTVVSVYDGATDRWVLGGEGFVSQRDPKTLAEIRRIDVGGTVEHIVLAKSANVALAYSCPDFCNVTRIQLDTGAQATLGRVTSEAPLVISADGSRAAFSRDGKLRVFTGDALEPSFTAPALSGSLNDAAVFTNEGMFLYGAANQVGRWDPGTGKAESHKVGHDADESLHFAGDPVLGRVVVSPAYYGNITVYDGTAPREITAPGRGCGSARASLEDPNQFECPVMGFRVDAAGALVPKSTGTALRLTEKHVLRIHAGFCEVVDRATGAILGTGDRELCSATFSADGTRLAYVDGTGAVTVRALADLTPVGLWRRSELEPRVADGTVMARFDRTLALFGPSNHQQVQLAESYRPHVYTPLGVFSSDNGRLTGVDLTGKVRLFAVEPGWNETRPNAALYASGTGLVTAAYGEADKKVGACRFGALCTEIDIAPSTGVAGYETPWIVTSTTAEPDAPNQVVYWLRHDEGREAPRRVIVGRDCSPPLLFEHGDKLVCPSGDKLVTFDTKTGQPVGEGLPLDLDRSPAPRDEELERAQRDRPGTRSDVAVLGHGNATLFLRTASWLGAAVHVEERALPRDATSDGGAPPAVASVTVLAQTFGVVRHDDGRVRLGGDAAAAERLLACRRGNELLPWSSCKAEALDVTP